MISHDLSVVEHMSDRVLVMFFGEVVEEGGWRDIFETPAHPYTRRLIDAIPSHEGVLAPPMPDHAAPLLAGRRFVSDGATAPMSFPRRRRPNSSRSPRSTASGWRPRDRG